MSELKIAADHPFLPIYEVEGNGYQLGLQIGRKCRDRIQKTLTPDNIWFQERKKKDIRNPGFLDGTLRLTKHFLPMYIEEIKGYSEGAQVDFRDLWILNSADYFEESCSDVILKSNDRIVLSHNEDFNNANSDLSYFLHIKTEENGEIFAHTYPGVIPGFSFGMNSHGICVSCDSIPNTDHTVGISRKVLDRWALESTTIDDFVQRISQKPRSGVFSYNIGSFFELKALNIETTEEEIVKTEPISSYFYHTNHYLSDKWKSKNQIKDPSTTSFSRYNRLKEIVPIAQPTPESALGIISDSKVFSYENEIFPGWYGRSFATSIVEMTEDTMVMTVWPYDRDKTKIVKVSLK